MYLTLVSGIGQSIPHARHVCPLTTIKIGVRMEIKPKYKYTPPAGSKRAAVRAEKKWYVYGIRGAHLLKIGITINVMKRLEAFRLGCPVALAIEHTIGPYSKSEALAKERRLHVDYAINHAHGEWYDMSYTVATVAFYG